MIVSSVDCPSSGSSDIWFETATIADTGRSSLSKFRVTTPSAIVAFVGSTKLKIIVSTISMISSSSTEEITTDPDSAFAGITSVSELTLYSVAKAVELSEITYVIIISCSETTSGVAVMVAVLDEFSTIVDAETAKVIAGESSLSSINTCAAEDEVMVALDGVPGVTIISSVYSSAVSSIDVKVIDPSIDPAKTLISGFNW